MATTTTAMTTLATTATATREFYNHVVQAKMFRKRVVEYCGGADRDDQNDDDDDDEMIVACYELTHMRLICENCGTRKSPQWRRGWHNVLGGIVWLCNACGLKMGHQQRCIYCLFVYTCGRFNAPNTLTPEAWIRCCHCGVWTHRQCEINARNDLALDGLVASRKFICAPCLRKS